MKLGKLHMHNIFQVHTVKRRLQ